MKTSTERVIELIAASPSPYHVTENAADLLENSGYVKINIFSPPAPLPRKFYFSRSNISGSVGSSLIAVCLPADQNGNKKAPKGMRICASHTDSPCFRLKPNAVMEGADYCRLNSERYGGSIWSTWLDRPLGIAGRVIIEKDGRITAKNAVIPGNILIPNVAIHMNRKINDGYAYSPAIDLVPLFGDKSSGKRLTERICLAVGCEEDQILDYELCIYNPQEGVVWGGDGEYFSAPRLDDLQCVFTSLLGFLNTDAPKENAAVLALFDCEEVGNTCISGADSDLLKLTAELIADDSGIKLCSLAAGSFLLSADNGHAVHPNHPEYSDPTNRPTLGGGIVLKYNSNKKYITDGESGAFVRSLCKTHGIKMQTFANRSDMTGGSTLGNVSGTQFSVLGADIGLAQLAMHSSYETAGCADNDAMIKLCSVFFAE